MIAVVGEAIVDMIEVEKGKYEARLGGAPANVAVAIAALGGSVSFVGRVSTARFGRQLLDRFTSAGVATKLIQRVHAPATMAVVGIDSAGVPTYDFYLQGTADWGWDVAELTQRLTGVDCIQFGSLAMMLDAQAFEAALAVPLGLGATTMFFDLNIRAALGADRATESARIDRQVKLAHIVKASEEDLRWLFGAGWLEAARRWARSGKLVLVSLGADGVIAMRADDPDLHTLARPVQVVDTVGAGDAFCGAFLVAMQRREMLRGRSVADFDRSALSEAIRFAADAASLACLSRGAAASRHEHVLEFAATHHLVDGRDG